MRLLKILLIIAIAIVMPGVGNAAPWNLPKLLTTSNAKVKFQVDTTWHMVHGAAKEIKGELLLTDPARYDSVSGKIIIPVAALDTDNSSRDETMRESMHADKFPEIQYKFERMDKICAPDTLTSGIACPFEINGNLTIRNVSRNVLLKGKVIFNGFNYVVSGETTIKWQDYGVEDPSIFIASVYPDTKIEIEITL